MKFRSYSILSILFTANLYVLTTCSTAGQYEHQANDGKDNATSMNQHWQNEDIRPAHKLIIEPVTKRFTLKTEPSVKKYKLLQYRSVEKIRRTNRPKIRPTRMTRTTNTITTTIPSTTEAPYMEDFSSAMDFDTTASGSGNERGVGAMSPEAMRLSQLISDEDLAAFQRVMTILYQNQIPTDQGRSIQNRNDYNAPPKVPAANPRSVKRTTEIPRTHSVEMSCKESSPCAYHVISDIYCMHNTKPNSYFQCSPGPDGRGVWVERQCPGGLRFYENGECGLEIFQPDGKFVNEQSAEIQPTTPKVTNIVKQPITVDNERETVQPMENRVNIQALIGRVNSTVPITSSTDLLTYSYGKFYPNFLNAMQQQSMSSNPITSPVLRPQTNNSAIIHSQAQQAINTPPMDYWNLPHTNHLSAIKPFTGTNNNNAYQSQAAPIQQGMTGPIWPTQRQIYENQQALYPSYRATNGAQIYDPTVGYRYPARFDYPMIYSGIRTMK